MNNLLRRDVHDEDGSRGFTLIELLVVTVVLAILAAIALPVFFGQRGKGYDAAVRSDLRNAATAEAAFLAGNDHYSTQSPVGAELGAEGFRYSSAGDYLGATPAIAVSVVGNDSFCLTARSASGSLLAYDSQAGGFQPDGVCS